VSSLFERIAVFLLLTLASGAGLAAYLEAGTNTTTSSDGQLFLQVLFGAFYLYFLTLIAARYQIVWALVVREKWTALLCLWCVLSTVWSIAPAETLRRSLALVGTTMVGLHIGMRFEPKQQLRILGACLGFCAVASLIAGLAFPDVGITSGGQWGGIFYLKNTFGRMMALGAICFAVSAFGKVQNRLLSASMFVLCATLLILSGSATAIVVGVLMFAVLPFRPLLKLQWRSFVVPAVIVAGVFVAGIGLAATHFDGILNALGRSDSLTGRLPLWRFVIQEITTRPFFGAGYSAFWVSSAGDQIRAAIAWDAPNAHNGFLETALGMGFIGLFLLSAGILKNLIHGVRAARAGKTIDYSWPLLYVLFIIFYSLTESSVLGVNSILWTVYVANSYWVTLDKLRAEEQTEMEIEESASADFSSCEPA
jgi:exopolysaccharide production protein ExoQ